MSLLYDADASEGKKIKRRLESLEEIATVSDELSPKSAGLSHAASDGPLSGADQVLDDKKNAQLESFGGHQAEFQADYVVWTCCQCNVPYYNTPSSKLCVCGHTPIGCIDCSSSPPQYSSSLEDRNSRKEESPLQPQSTNDAQSDEKSWSKGYSKLSDEQLAADGNRYLTFKTKR